MDQSDPIEVTRLGARGDGIADGPDGPLYIPFSAPGDLIRVLKTASRGDGKVAVKSELVSPGAGRVAPPCPHYGTCGGCSLQHVALNQIAAFKRDLLADALSKRGFTNIDVAETVSVPAGTRRRARLSCIKTVKGWVIGFNERGTNRITGIEGCLILRPSLTALLPTLKTLLNGLPSMGRGGDIQLTEGSSGVEVVLLPEKPKDLTLDERYLLTDWAEETDLSRLVWQDRSGADPVVERRPFVLRIKGATLAPPAAAFLQASEDGEAAIVEQALTAAKGARRVADLFCGCGTISLPLAAAGHSVHAVEIDRSLLAAVQRMGGGNVTIEARDLARSPIPTAELAPYDAVVFDPPRAGAADQATEIAASSVPTVVAVSCNPATLARDLRILADGGYRIDSVTPIDQFTWSAHLEAVAILHRDA